MRFPLKAPEWLKLKILCSEIKITSIGESRTNDPSDGSVKWHKHLQNRLFF